MAWLVLAIVAISAVWALTAHWVEALRIRALWIVTGIAHVLVMAQVIVGVIVLNQTDAEVSQTHTFYGFLTLVAITILYAYRTQLADHLYLLYGGGGLFLVGLVIRAMLLDPTPLV